MARAGHEGQPIEYSPFTPEKGAQLVFFGYRFSQGEGKLNDAIFKYLHSIKPGWKISDQAKKTILSLSRTRVDNFLKHSENSPIAKGKVAHAPPISYDLERMVEDMQTVFNGNESPKVLREINTASITDITIFEIGQDHYFLIKKGGRPRKGLDPKTIQGDSWLSFTVFHALMSNPTGIEEYDRMFQDVNGFIRSSRFGGVDRETDAQLDNVVRVYNEHHLDKPFVW